ncbi:MAG: SDR family oxidoreductase [Planctomycetota bacterium]
MRRLVIGCGYLGQEVAQAWLEQGDIVYVTTRSPDRARVFQDMGFLPIVTDITDEEPPGKVPVVDTVLIAVGMDRSRYDSIRSVYVNGLANILSWLPDGTGQIIYVSSTGVYGQTGGEEITETSTAEPVREGGIACLEAERLLTKSRFARHATILRLAGIYGPGRVPSAEKIRSRNVSSLNPDGHINLIHRDDAVTAILNTAALGVMGETILVSDGNAPLRRDYYQILANLYDLGPIEWPASLSAGQQESQSSARSAGKGKRIRNERMKSLLQFEPLWSDLEAGIRNAIGLEGQQG